MESSGDAPASVSSAAVGPPATTIDDLPSEALSHVGSYLAKPSRALLGVAMVAPSKSWVRHSNTANSVGWLCQYGDQEWEVLDFVSVDERLAARLTDDDLAAVLLGIDGASSVKRLMLTHCWEVTGRGLDPLRSSSVIEQLDISCLRPGRPLYRVPLCPATCPWLTGASPEGIKSSILTSEPKNSLSEDLVASFLYDIINIEACSLRQLQLPQKWCGYRYVDESSLWLQTPCSFSLAFKLSGIEVPGWSGYYESTRNSCNIDAISIAREVRTSAANVSAQLANHG